MTYGSKGNFKATILDKEELKFFWNLIVVSLVIQNNFNKHIKTIPINQMNFFVLYFRHLPFSINFDVSFHPEGFLFLWNFGLLYFHYCYLSSYEEYTYVYMWMLCVIFSATILDLREILWFKDIHWFA